jgi:hypothetical protein
MNTCINTKYSATLTELFIWVEMVLQITPASVVYMTGKAVNNEKHLGFLLLRYQYTDKKMNPFQADHMQFVRP